MFGSVAGPSAMEIGGPAPTFKSDEPGTLLQVIRRDEEELLSGVRAAVLPSYEETTLYDAVICQLEKEHACMKRQMEESARELSKLKRELEELRLEKEALEF